VNDYCVLYDHEKPALSISTINDAIELNMGRFLDDKPPFGVVRMWLERDQAVRFVQAYGACLAHRSIVRWQPSAKPVGQAR